MLKDELIEKCTLCQNTVEISKNEAEEIISLCNKTDRQLAIIVAQSEIISKLTNKLKGVEDAIKDKRDRQLAVKPLECEIPEGFEYLLTGRCPVCNTGLWGKGTHYCHWCGQAIKWT